MDAIESGLLFDNKTEEPVGVQEIADYLGKKPNTIRSWCSSGREKIPKFRLGNKWMFFKSEVRAWLITKQKEEL